jgi:hypothetical protein
LLFFEAETLLTRMDKDIEDSQTKPLSHLVMIVNLHPFKQQWGHIDLLEVEFYWIIIIIVVAAAAAAAVVAAAVAAAAAVVEVVAVAV